MDLEKIRGYLCEILPEAGNILKKYFVKKNYSLHGKGGLDIATEADVASEDFIKEKILVKFSDASFLAEETSVGDFLKFKNRKNLFVIDPLDGTMNFVRGNSNFAISVALVNSSIPALGVCYIPMKDELYWAQADKKGAYFNGKKIHVSSTSNPEGMSFACDWVPYNIDKRLELLEWLRKIIPYARQIKSMGCAVNDSLSLARGIVDVYLNPGLKPWDIAAATLIVKKAGGKITDLNGEDVNVFEPDVLITNGHLHQIFLELINKN